jgi:hypothetical protein
VLNDKSAVVVFSPVKKGAEMEANEESLTQSVRQTAKELGIGVNQAYEAVRRGEIPHIKIGKRRVTRGRIAGAVLCLFCSCRSSSVSGL